MMGAPAAAITADTARGSWWQEASGAVADLGVLVPITVALIVGNGLSTTAVLLPAGLLYLAVAWSYRAPVAVQPLKAFGAAAIASGAGSDVIAAGSLLMGTVFLALGSSGVLDRVAAGFPRPVIRGVQLAVGLTFARIAWGMLTAPPSTFVHHWPTTVGAMVCAGTTAVLLRWRRGTALAAVGIGLGVALLASLGDWAPGLGPTAVALPHISAAELVLAATVLVLPQVPLTLANSCLAPADAAKTYFPHAGRAITPSRLARSLGLANLGVGAISGMPLCHGAGGMSAHHAFGARSWRAPALIGATLTLAALALGAGLESVLRAFPLPILAALLLVAGITHVGLLRDLRGAGPWLMALVVGTLGAGGHLLAGVIIGLVLAGAARLVRRAHDGQPAGSGAAGARVRAQPVGLEPPERR